MYKFMQIEKFAKVIFDTGETAKKASKIMEGILQAQSPRISDIADQMAGNDDANYKMVQRFLKQENLDVILVDAKINGLLEKMANFKGTSAPKWINKEQV